MATRHPAAGGAVGGGGRGGQRPPRAFDFGVDSASWCPVRGSSPELISESNSIMCSPWPQVRGSSTSTTTTTSPRTPSPGIRTGPCGTGASGGPTSTAAVACWSAARSTRTSPTPRSTPWPSPGPLFDWYRGNPRRQMITEAFGELEPMRPEYRDREVRLKVMDEQGLAGTLLFPTLGVGIEDALKHDPEAVSQGVRGLQPMARGRLGLPLRGPHLRRPVHPPPRSDRGSRRAAPA